MGTATHREREKQRKKNIRFIILEDISEGDILEREVFFMRVTSDGRRDFTDWIESGRTVSRKRP